uniref:Uncharacterized protein n=1 Tax=Phytophthora ramorum TaxID=164328 RepID=H3GX80_PHYRM
MVVAASMVMAWRMLLVVDVVLRVDDGLLDVVVATVLLVRKLVLLMAALMMVAWPMLLVVDVVKTVELLACQLSVLIALWTEVGLRMRSVLTTVGHLLFPELAIRSPWQLKVVVTA